MFRTAVWHHGKVLSQSQGYHAREKYLARGNTAPRRPVALIQRPPAVELLRCHVCQASSESGMPNHDVLDAYWAQCYNNDAQMKVTVANVASFPKPILAMLDAPLPRQDDVLSVLGFRGMALRSSNSQSRSPFTS